MINRIAEHLEPEVKKQGAQSSLRTKMAQDWLEPVERVIADHPAASLATAFVLGVAIAWWIKRN
ncbi:MAG: hypothetical protein MUF06_05735 [Pirellulaceae bacterium]|jgi:hypothetical protein|nr:hypothetical protein [Pirellulaceae bacterium]